MEILMTLPSHINKHNLIFIATLTVLMSSTVLASATANHNATYAQNLVNKFANSNITWQGPLRSEPLAKNKKIVVVALTLSSVSNQRVTAGIKEAAKLGGWQVTVIDGRGTPENFAAGIDTAIAEGADGIALLGTQYVPQALSRAKAAHIPVVGAIDTTANPLFKAGYYNHIVAERGKEIGAAAAAQLVADLGPHATVATFSAARGDPLGDLLTEGADEVFHKSGNPVATDLTLEFSELGTGTIGQKAVAAVQEHPEIKAFWVSWDAPAAEIIHAFKNAGIHIPVYSTYADPQDIALIRSGTLQKADVAVPLEWDGWAVVDNFNRIFKGSPLAKDANDGVPIKLLNANNLGRSLPDGSVAWNGGYNFRAKYKQLWNIQ
jgi:ribose transport system substrate-binding protein